MNEGICGVDYPTSSRPVVVTRDVLADDAGNYSGRDVKAGETLYVSRLATYGCIGHEGIGLTERPGLYPFFEFPRDAIRLVEGTSENAGTGVQADRCSVPEAG